MIEGIVRDDSTGAPLAGSWVAILMPSCRSITDGAGRFRISGLPAAAVRYDAGFAGYRDFKPAEVRVSHDQPTVIEIGLRRGGPLDDCRADTACARLLPEQPARGWRGRQDLELIAYATAIAIAWKDIQRQGVRYACVAASEPGILDELRRRFGQVVPVTACDRTEGPGSRFYHVATGSPAFIARITNGHARAGRRHRFTVSYMLGGLWGEAWDCDFVTNGRNWQPATCVQTMQF